VDFGELFEEEVVVGHGVENAWRSEDDAVGRAKDGNENGERDEFAGPGPKHARGGSGGDGVTCGGGCGAERDEIGDVGDEIERDEDERAQKKRARK
jgi:hypothetical protein